MKTKIIIFASLLLFTGCSKDSINNPLIESDRIIANNSLIDSDGITAAYNLSAVDSLASTYSKGLQLISIQSDNSDSNGYAQRWCFGYSSDGMAVDYYFHTTSKEVKYDSTSTLKITGSSFITHQWFNSNEALGIAEKNGGKEFRTDNLNYTIEVSLGEPVIPNTTTFWYITYRSKLDTTKSLFIGIDANTGVVALKYP